jgi:hypothetical protein
LRYDQQRVAITNARALAIAPTLEREGVTIAMHHSAIRNFRDEEEVRAKYPRELERLIIELTGAVRVNVLGGAGLVRCTERSPDYKTGMNKPLARFPQVDFTPNTSPELSSTVFGPTPESLKRGQRLIVYHVWRVLSEPPQDVPLAVLDARTVAQDDLRPSDCVYGQSGDPTICPVLGAYVLCHSLIHRWLYYPDMQPNEVLIFRSYDNEPVWRAGVPRSHFDDPTCPLGVPPTASIEVRVYAVYD